MKRKFLDALECALAAGTIALAFKLDDPLMATARGELRWAIYGLAAGMTLWAWRRRRLVFGLPWGALLLGLAFAQFHAERKRQALLAAPAETLRQFGRHFIVGYRDSGEVERLVTLGHIGGIFVTTHNARAADLAGEIAHLQALRRQSGEAALIVAADQEGGAVSRLSPPLPAPPALSALAALPGEARRAAAKRQGAEMGRELARLGVTVDFAPVVDLASARPASSLDLHSRIAQRAISADPQIVSETALGFVEGMETAGVRATLKHFPGLGRVAADTHFVRAEIDAARQDLEASDFAPFRKLLAQSHALLMAGHVVARGYDPDWPASQSKILIEGLVRRQWGFDGAIVTDDLAMGAVSRYDLCRGVVASLGAGVDLLLVSFDGAQFYDLMDCLMQANARGELDAQALARSAHRLDALLGAAER